MSIIYLIIFLIILTLIFSYFYMFRLKSKYLNIEEGNIVYTSGVDGIISEAITVGKIFKKNTNLFVEFFVDFNQLKYVKVNK